MTPVKPILKPITHQEPSTVSIAMRGPISRTAARKLRRITENMPDIGATKRKFDQQFS